MLQIKIKETSEKLNIENVTAKFFKSLVSTIAEDITGNMEKERVVSQDIGGVYGKPKPLNADYRAWKIKNGLSGRIFRKEEEMINSVQIKRNGNFNSTIYVGGVADSYASYVNEKRKFFGISKKIINDIEEQFNKLKIA